MLSFAESANANAVAENSITDKDIPFIEESFDNSSNTNNNGALMALSQPPL